MYGLLPQDPLQVLGPGLLRLPAACLQGVRVLAFPLSEPDLETQASVSTVLGHADIARLFRDKDLLMILIDASNVAYSLESIKTQNA